MNYQTIIDLVPVLSLLNGYAMQGERVVSVQYRDTHDLHGNHSGREVCCIEFPNGSFQLVKGGWVLSVNESPVAIFPIV